jgi:hypothetical protein
MGSITFVRGDNGKSKFIVNRGNVAKIYDTKTFLSEVDVAEILNEHKPEGTDDECMATGSQSGRD